MKPKIAKKAEEDGSKLAPAPAPQAGLYAPKIPRKKEQQQAARLGVQEQEGEGNGVYSAWLAQWVKNITDTYNAESDHPHCIPVLAIAFQNGHVISAEPPSPKASCGEEADRALELAVRNAPRPAAPVGFGSDEQDWLLYQRE